MASQTNPHFNNMTQIERIILKERILVFIEVGLLKEIETGQVEAGNAW